jgi:hypothetical protein
MAIDTNVPRSRRALLAGGIGGLAAFVASTLGRPLPAQAGTDGDVVLGATNTASATTIVEVGDLQGYPDAPTYPIGVYGRAGTPGLAAAGVYGWSYTGYGVVGSSIEHDGVRGISPYGVGVRGFSTAGIGVIGGSTSGYALQTSGRLAFQKVSGIARLLVGRTSVTVSVGLDITSSSFVFLSPMANLAGRDLWYTTDKTANTITIRISKAHIGDLWVGWLMLW